MEEFKSTEFPRYCSPTFLVPKHPAGKRMVGDYRKLNQRTVPHAGFLPDLEETVERIAATKFKSKMDMRSGFWQVTLSEKAKELSAFVIPNGRVFRWKIMPFGLANAPGIFQELMMQAIARMRRRPEVRSLLEKGSVVAAFFDDVCIGAPTQAEHLTLLKAFFETCVDMELRIKLSKCAFMQEKLSYLGFEVGVGWWRPSADNTRVTQGLTVRNLKDLRSLLGRATFSGDTFRDSHSPATS